MHAPSLREVMENGNVLVNKPGEMASCIGCRFKTHCPSTIEILCCIRADTRIAGVLAFTSFTKEGQKRITENTSVYLNAITELANMIGSLLLSRDGGASPVNLDANLLASMELCNQPMLLTDAHGVICSTTSSRRTSSACAIFQRHRSGSFSRTRSSSASWRATIYMRRASTSAMRPRRYPPVPSWSTTR